MNSLSGIVDKVYEKFAAVGAPPSTRFDVMAHNYTLRTTYDKYRQFASTGDESPSFAISDAAEVAPGVHKVSVFCLLGASKRKLVDFTCDIGV